VGTGVHSSSWVLSSRRRALRWEWKSRVSLCVCVCVERSLNTRALACLGYAGQFLPPVVVPNERALLSSVAKFPYTALSKAGFYNLWRWGGILLRSPAVFMIASLVRASKKTLEWRDHWFSLSAAAWSSSFF